MSDDPMVPEFDDLFWAKVDQRVNEVRNITMTELRQAENDLLAAQVEADVVPVFPSPFWNRVNKRAASVRTMALDELSDAEERLVNGPEATATSWHRRIPVPAMIRRVWRPGPARMPLRSRVNTLGFVTAVLAVLLLLPQVMPIASLADVRNRGPLSIFFTEQPRRESPPSGDGSGPQSTPAGSAAGEQRPAGNRSGSKSPGVSPSPAGSAAKSSASGEGGSGGGTGGTDSPDVLGVSGASNPGAGANGAASADGADGVDAPSRPEAPSNLLVTAVDDTSVRLRWKDRSSNETGFVIERSGDSTVRVLDANQKSFVWSGLAAGSDACFRVKARNETGDSSWLASQFRCVKTHDARTVEGPVVLQALACSNESSLTTTADLQETEIRFVNQTGHPVRIYEMEEGVRERTPKVVPSGGSTTETTFLGNPYVVTSDDETAGCLAIYLGRSWSGVANITDPA